MKEITKETTCCALYHIGERNFGVYWFLLKNGPLSIGVRGLAAYLNTSKDTVLRLLNKLQDLGWIEITKSTKHDQGYYEPDAIRVLSHDEFVTKFGSGWCQHCLEKVNEGIFESVNRKAILTCRTRETGSRSSLVRETGTSTITRETGTKISKSQPNGLRSVISPVSAVIPDIRNSSNSNIITVTDYSNGSICGNDMQVSSARQGDNSYKSTTGDRYWMLRLKKPAETISKDERQIWDEIRKELKSYHSQVKEEEQANVYFLRLLMDLENFFYDGLLTYANIQGIVATGLSWLTDGAMAKMLDTLLHYLPDETWRDDARKIQLKEKYSPFLAIRA